MTGTYFRVLRDNKWTSVAAQHLTEEELCAKFSHRSPAELVNWINMLCAEIRKMETLLLAAKEEANTEQAREEDESLGSHNQPGAAGSA